MKSVLCSMLVVFQYVVACGQDYGGYDELPELPLPFTIDSAYLMSLSSLPSSTINYHTERLLQPGTEALVCRNVDIGIVKLDTTILVVFGNYQLYRDSLEMLRCYCVVVGISGIWHCSYDMGELTTWKNGHHWLTTSVVSTEVIAYFQIPKSKYAINAKSKYDIDIKICGEYANYFN